jgi:hypothetical protein
VSHEILSLEIFKPSFSLLSFSSMASMSHYQENSSKNLDSKWNGHFISPRDMAFGIAGISILAISVMAVLQQ